MGRVTDSIVGIDKWTSAFAPIVSLSLSYWLWSLSLWSEMWSKNAESVVWSLRKAVLHRHWCYCYYETVKYEDSSFGVKKIVHDALGVHTTIDGSGSQTETKYNEFRCNMRIFQWSIAHIPTFCCCWQRQQVRCIQYIYITASNEWCSTPYRTTVSPQSQSQS